MKQLKSSLGDLRRLFVRTITLRDIAEPLASFDGRQSAEEVRAFMEEREFDVVGVREHGLVTGYVLRAALTSGEITAQRRIFASGEVLSDTEPLLAAFAALREQRHFFVTMLGHVGGIVTRGDLQKAPVRLWLFGLLSLLEMQLLRVIRERYPADSWNSLVTEERLSVARKLFDERRRRNEENDLSDCLQLGDKTAIFSRDQTLFALSGFPSKRALDEFFKEVGTLRNALAHANDILCGRWPDLANLAVKLEDLLERLEGATFPRGGNTEA